MAKFPPPWTLKDLAEKLGAPFAGDPSTIISVPVPAGVSNLRGIAFAGDEAYLKKAEQGELAAILLPPGLTSDKFGYINVSNPRQVFGLILSWCAVPLPISNGVHPTAVIAPSARIEDGARIGAYAVIEENASVAKGARIYSFAYVGDNCHIGEDAVLYPHAVLVQNVTVGKRSVVHSGAILGADGFGYAWDGKVQQKIPQVGSVILADDVEIGALTTVDRATAGATSIGTDSKIDNLVQIAHNVKVGEHTVIAAQCGIPGSVTIGDRVTMAGQVAVNDHRTVGNDVVLAGRTGVTQDVLEAGVYFGLPAAPIREAMRVMLAQNKLPELIQRVRQLEKKIQELEDATKKNDS